MRRAQVVRPSAGRDQRSGAIVPDRQRSAPASPAVERGVTGPLRPPARSVESPDARRASASADVRPARRDVAYFAFCVYTFILICRPQDYVSALVPLRLALMFTVITFGLTLATGGFARRRLFSIPPTAAYLAFFAAMCVGIPFSIYRRASFEFVILGYIVNVIFFLLFVVHVNTLVRLKRIIVIVMVSAFIFSAIGLSQGRFQDGRYVTSTTMFDPNDVAFVEVSLLAFSFCVLLGPFRALTRVMALAGILMGVVVTLLTGSRGGLVALVTMLVLFLMMKVTKVSKVRKAIMLIGIVVAGAMNADRINVERYLTLGSLTSDYNLQDESGRAQIWERGVALFLAEPLTGVGVDGFAEAIGSMRQREYLTPQWQSPHSSYVQVVTETGLLGAIPFATVLVVCGRNMFRLRRLGGTSVLADVGAFSGILFVGFSAQLLGAAFLTQAYSLLFTLFFGVAASLHQIAAAAESSARRDA
jgi:O-antigen ligase